MTYSYVLLLVTIFMSFISYTSSWIYPRKYYTEDRRWKEGNKPSTVPVGLECSTAELLLVYDCSEVFSRYTELCGNHCAVLRRQDLYVQLYTVKLFMCHIFILHVYLSSLSHLYMGVGYYPGVGTLFQTYTVMCWRHIPVQRILVAKFPFP